VDIASTNTTQNGSPQYPYRTIQQAADVAASGDVVRIRAGYYRETVDLSARADHVTYRAEHPGTAVILGSERFGAPGSTNLHQWRQLTAAEVDLPAGVHYSNVYKLALPNWTYTHWSGVKTCAVEIAALLDATGGVTRLPCARAPNWTVDMADVFQRVHYHSNWWTADGSTVSNNTGVRWLTDVDALPPGRYNDLRGARAFVLDHQQAHYFFRAFIVSQRFDEARIQFDITIDHEGLNGIGPRTKYYLENDTEFMDQPGEWALVNNGRTAMVYVLTGSGGAYGLSLPPTALGAVELSKRHTGMELTGRSHVRLEGLAFRCITKDHERQYYNGSQGAVVINNADEQRSHAITLDRLDISHGCMGVFMAQSTGLSNTISRALLCNSVIRDMDDSGYYLSQWPRWQPSGNEDIRLISNTFLRIGFRPLINGTLAVNIANSINQLLFRHNYIGFCAHNGMQIQNGNPGIMLVEDNLFEWNCLCCTDAGGFKFHSSDARVFHKALVKGNLSRYNYGWTYAAERVDMGYAWIPAARKGMRGHGFYVDVTGGVCYYRNVAVENGGWGITYSKAHHSGTNYVYHNTLCRAAGAIEFGDPGTGELRADTRIINNLYVNNIRNNTFISQSQGDVFNNTARTISALPGMQVDYNAYRLLDMPPAAQYVFEFSHTGGQIQHQTVLAVRTNTPCEHHGLQTSTPMLLNEDGDACADFTPLQSSPLCDMAETPAPVHELIAWLNTNYLMVIGEPLIEDVPMIGAAYDIGAIEAIPEPSFMRHFVSFAVGIFCHMNIRSRVCV